MESYRWNNSNLNVEVMWLECSGLQKRRMVATGMAHYAVHVISVAHGHHPSSARLMLIRSGQRIWCNSQTRVFSLEVTSSICQKQFHFPLIQYIQIPSWNSVFVQNTYYAMLKSTLYALYRLFSYCVALVRSVDVIFQSSNDLTNLVLLASFNIDETLQKIKGRSAN